MNSQFIPDRVSIVDRSSGESANVNNGGLDTNIQDQTTKALDLLFIQDISQTTTAATVAPNDTTITLTSTVGYTDGVIVSLFDGAGNFFFGEQVGAPAGNVITLDRPIDQNFAAGVTSLSATSNMAVNGSLASPEIFQIGPVGLASNVSGDITRFVGYIQDGTDMDDAKFGGIPALTNGILIRRKNDATSDYTNYWDAKTNGQIALLAYDTVYTDKAPSGSYGLRFRSTYGSQAKHGVVIRVQPGDALEILIQDDLTGLEGFWITAQGHLTD